MKAVMMSIQPKWCELIASGKKTIEVRKTRPKIDTPFKCYIYCTKAKCEKDRLVLLPYGYALGDLSSVFTEIGNGKVIGEFVCDRIEDISYNEVLVDGTLYKSYYYLQHGSKSLKKTCLTIQEIKKYLNGKYGFGWHISDLVIYDKQKSLEMFPIGKIARDCGCGGYMVYDKILTIPPRSWCYVEEKE